MHIKAITVSVFVALIMVSTLVGAAGLPDVHSGNHRGVFLNDAAMLGISSSASLNWAGYVVTGNDVTYVTGSFVVPSVAVSSGATAHTGLPGQGHHSTSSSTTYAAFWVGIDGYSSSTVEQAGVLMEDSGGVASYSAWYEFYPAAPVYASWSPQAGDLISVTVQYYSNGTMVATVTDITTDNSFSSPYEPASSYQRNSAEWITEAPSSARQILPLADFGKVYFGVDYTNIQNTNYATIGGTYGSIAVLSSSFTTYSLSMVNRNGSLKAAPSSLSTDGTSFSVTWYSS